MKHYNVPIGRYKMNHYRVGKVLPAEYPPGPPKIELTEVCETHYPAGVCACGRYLLTWGQE